VGKYLKMLDSIRDTINSKPIYFSINMVGCDTKFGEECLCMLGPFTIDFKELYMSSTKEGHVHTLSVLQVGSPKILITNYGHVHTLI
jgi:hypothetical protein